MRRPKAIPRAVLSTRKRTPEKKDYGHRKSVRLEAPSGVRLFRPRRPSKTPLLSAFSATAVCFRENAQPGCFLFSSATLGSTQVRFLSQESAIDDIFLLIQLNSQGWSNLKQFRDGIGDMVRMNGDVPHFLQRNVE
jgi:hypothetical protein